MPQRDRTLERPPESNSTLESSVQPLMFHQVNLHIIDGEGVVSHNKARKGLLMQYSVRGAMEEVRRMSGELARTLQDVRNHCVVDIVMRCAILYNNGGVYWTPEQPWTPPAPTASYVTNDVKPDRYGASGISDDTSGGGASSSNEWPLLCYEDARSLSTHTYRYTCDETRLGIESCRRLELIDSVFRGKLREVGIIAAFNNHNKQRSWDIMGVLYPGHPFYPLAISAVLERYAVAPDEVPSLDDICTVLRTPSLVRPFGYLGHEQPEQPEQPGYVSIMQHVDNVSITHVMCIVVLALVCYLAIMSRRRALTRSRSRAGT